MFIIDPIDADPTTMLVTESEITSERLYVRQIRVPAKLETQPCPHCHGKGTVKVKVPV